MKSEQSHVIQEEDSKRESTAGNFSPEKRMLGRAPRIDIDALVLDASHDIHEETSSKPIGSGNNSL
eukprot:CAMPEP_0185616816 /NCGR_PEP_ID=MMETSP0436-20130131/41190_1 /TAXON_ID=626734 ORGANISM="Favella taraikaensis, Strain Fe Narragansett Bay" /NCGR_SAMPLE_ID=MMETSP0436 /ASSEMBLY_ACC=CAM_ASM_000390 /LENGTH=65 /DNA_ID=CAMNT_0028253883 /DNA_START=51 /DNA_END=248 /DNA_ORIENTATION=-